MCDVGTTQYENETIKCDKKIRKLPNVTKELSHIISKLYNMIMEPSNTKKK